MTFHYVWQQVLNCGRSNKNMVGRAADRLSSLPDEILHHILCFGIDTKQVIQMSILSKRWKTLWHSVASLRFNCADISPQSIRFVTEALFDRIHSNPNLNIKPILNINSFSLSHARNCPVELWILSAILLRVQELHLSSLELTYTAGFDQLKMLSLCYVVLRPSLPEEHIFPDLANLEKLTMNECNVEFITILRVRAPLLKYLMIRNEHERGCQYCDFALEAPNLISVELHGWLYKNYNLEDLPCLTTAHINIAVTEMKKASYDRCLKKIVLAICNVESLTLSANAFQIYPALLKRLPTELKRSGDKFHNLKFLKLINLQDDGHIVALARLLKHFSSEVFGPKVKGEKWREKLSFRCALRNLKTIEVLNLNGSENELKFLDFLVKSSPKLEKLSVQKTFWMSDEEVHRISEYRKRLPSHLTVFSNGIRI